MATFPTQTTGDLVSAADWNQIGDYAAAGQLGYAERTTDQDGFFGTDAAIATLTVDVDTGGGRRIRVSCGVTVRSRDAGVVSLLRIRREGSQVAFVRQHHHAGGTSGEKYYDFDVVLTPASGVQTYKLTLQRESGTDAIDVKASTSSKAFILVEDIAAV